MVSQTPPQEHIAQPGVFFEKNKFDALVWQKGIDVIHETALQCPCKSRDTNQLSTCKNCGGSGWIFCNPVKTRAVVQSMNAVNEFKDWSEKVRGMIKITGLEYDQFSTMDRLTVEDANAIHNEVIYFDVKGPDLFAYTTYNIKQPIIFAVFNDADHTPTQLLKDVDYTIERNIIKITNLTIKARSNVRGTFRYYHAPQYHVLEMSRETMTQWKNKIDDKEIYLPVHGVAQRTHYHLDMENLAKTRMLVNEFINEAKK